MSGQFLFWQELTAAQIASLAPEAIVVVPIGATEQHGPHLATGTDTFLADAILEDLHRVPPSSGICLRLPTLPLGASDHHVSFGGTVSLPPLLFCELLVAQLRCLAAQGHKRILLFNSHGGNIAPMQTALAEVAVELHSHRIVAGGLSYWQLAQDNWKSIPELTGRALSHACEFETSMMYFARPDLQRLPPPARYDWQDSIDERCSLALPFAASTPTGAFGDPAIATAEIGEKLVRRAADALRSFLADFAEYRPSPVSTTDTVSV